LVVIIIFLNPRHFVVLIGASIRNTVDFVALFNTGQSNSFSLERRHSHNKKTTKKQLEAKDILPNINRIGIQAAERAENAVFVPGDLDL